MAETALPTIFRCSLPGSGSVSREWRDRDGYLFPIVRKLSATTPRTDRGVSNGSDPQYKQVEVVHSDSGDAVHKQNTREVAKNPKTKHKKLLKLLLSSPVLDDNRLRLYPALSHKFSYPRYTRILFTSTVVTVPLEKEQQKIHLDGKRCNSLKVLI
ncbi:hypothetical protein TNCT_104491 [Trichonephila clavata]|uniref:Uncharacterized protein n=1 Tax=Trichonephila clavata TaxID=2740835 RepID=A0A8X6FXX2_TRICU|nr:hypothetical protein TNCT_104491 [Trichonephila clavata]